MNLELCGMEELCAKAVAAGDQQAALDALATFFSPSQRTLRFLSEGGNRCRRRFGGRGSPQAPFRGLRHFLLIPGSGQLVLKLPPRRRIKVLPRQRIAVGTEPPSAIWGVSRVYRRHR